MRTSWGVVVTRRVYRVTFPLVRIYTDSLFVLKWRISLLPIIRSIYHRNNCITKSVGKQIIVTNYRCGTKTDSPWFYGAKFDPDEHKSGWTGLVSFQYQQQRGPPPPPPTNNGGPPHTNVARWCSLLTRFCIDRFVVSHPIPHIGCGPMVGVFGPFLLTSIARYTHLESWI